MNSGIWLLGPRYRPLAVPALPPVQPVEVELGKLLAALELPRSNLGHVGMADLGFAEQERERERERRRVEEMGKRLRGLLQATIVRILEKLIFARE